MFENEVKITFSNSAAENQRGHEDQSLFVTGKRLHEDTDVSRESKNRLNESS